MRQRRGSCILVGQGQRAERKEPETWCPPRTAVQGPRGQGGRGPSSKVLAVWSDIGSILVHAEHRVLSPPSSLQTLGTRAALSANSPCAALPALDPQERDTHAPALCGSVARVQGRERPRLAPFHSLNLPTQPHDPRRRVKATEPASPGRSVAPPSPPSSKSREHPSEPNLKLRGRSQLLQHH